jgi:hypothetical protein
VVNNDVSPLGEVEGNHKRVKHFPVLNVVGRARLAIYVWTVPLYSIHRINCRKWILWLQRSFEDNSLSVNGELLFRVNTLTVNHQSSRPAIMTVTVSYHHSSSSMLFLLLP